MPNCLYVCTSNQLLHTSYPSIVTHNKVPKLGLHSKQLACAKLTYKQEKSVVA
jgi:hypothetical protein